MSFIDKAKAEGRITTDSIKLGEQIARVAEKSVLKVAADGDADERCKTCAFRAGTAPNQCADTLLDVMKCIVESEPFFCHDPKRLNRICHGWFAVAATVKGFPVKKVPWGFSHEDDADSQTADYVRHKTAKKTGATPSASSTIPPSLNSPAATRWLRRSSRAFLCTSSPPPESSLWRRNPLQ